MLHIFLIFFIYQNIIYHLIKVISLLVAMHIEYVYMYMYVYIPKVRLQLEDDMSQSFD